MHDVISIRQIMLKMEQGRFFLVSFLITVTLKWYNLLVYLGYDEALTDVKKMTEKVYFLHTTYSANKDLSNKLKKNACISLNAVALAR